MMKTLSKSDFAELDTTAVKYDFQSYCQCVHRGAWVSAKHLEVVCNRLDHIIAGDLRRLMIFMPPRHGKSMCVTETFPSYFLGRNPEKRVIEVSYGDTLARRFGRLNRRKIEEYGASIFGIEVDKKNSSVTDWSLKDKTGGMISAGFGGSLSGFGADLLIIDDPIKNFEEAHSIVYRDRIWNEWRNTIYNRLHAGASVIIILTRWHEDDIAGRLLDPANGVADEWEIVSLPSLCESEDDLLGRRIGEALWPEHGYDEAWMEQTKTAIGTLSFTALHQQRPSPQEGAIFNRSWWKRYDKPPKEIPFIAISWDCTFKDKKSSDFVVGQVWGFKGADRYLLDQVRRRMNFTATLKAVQNLSKKWQNASVVLIEDTANGPAVIVTLKKEVSGIIPITPQGGKHVRAQAVSPQVEAGNVYLPRERWVSDFIDELSNFPNGANDDQVDAMSQALIWYKMKRTPKVWRV